MEENEIMTDVEVMAEIGAEFVKECYDDYIKHQSVRFPVVPTIIGASFLAGVTAIAVYHKKIAKVFVEKRVEHARKVIEKYDSEPVVDNYVAVDPGNSEEV